MQEISRNIPWEFTDKVVTPWGGMRMFKEFLDKTGIREELRAAGLPEPGSNCGYDPILIVESFWVNVWLGGVNFSHTAMVRFDNGLKKIFGWHRLPCVSTYTRFFKRFRREDVDHIFGKINRWFFEQMPEKTFTVDLDSSVITRYGKQEGSIVGTTRKSPGGLAIIRLWPLSLTCVW